MIKRGGLKSATVKTKVSPSYLDPSRPQQTLQMLDGVHIPPSFTNSQAKPHIQQQLVAGSHIHSVHFQR